MSLKNFLNCVITKVRILTVITALIVHTQKLCWLGLCPEEKPAETTIGSVIFAIALGLLLAEYDMVPDKLHCPSTTVYYILMTAGTILFTNLAFRLIWLPICDPLAMDFLSVMAVTINFIQDLTGICTKLPELLGDETTHTVLMAAIALAILFWIADGVGIICCAKENIVIKFPWKKESRRSGGNGSGIKRVSFAHCPRMKSGRSRRRYGRRPPHHGSMEALYSTDEDGNAHHSELTHTSSDTTPSTLNSPCILQEFVDDTHLLREELS